MKLFINEWIVEPFRMLTAVGQLIFGLLAFVVITFLLGMLAMRFFRPRPREPEDVINKTVQTDICFFIGGPLDHRCLQVPTSATHYFARKPTPPMQGVWHCKTPESLEHVNGQRVTYHRTGPQEFTLECDGEEVEHDWKFEDQSFDHAFGTERIHCERCTKCGATRAAEPKDWPDDVA
jgi:hypothetical protein